MARRIHLKEQGFTIIELLIASTVFSVILILCTAGLIQISRIYQKTTLTSQTQEVARSAISHISEGLQFNSGDYKPLTDASGISGFCVDNKRYSYILNTKIDSTNPHALVVDSPVGGCFSSTPPSFSGPDRVELLARNMRLQNLEVLPMSDNLFEIRLTVAYGDDDLFDGSGNCVPSMLGGSFCAVSRLSTTVQKRVIR